MAFTTNNISVVIIPPSFPNGYCPETWQEFANDFAADVLISLPGQFSGIIISETEPAPEDRDKLWFRLLGPTGPLDYRGPFQFFNGQWVAPYRTPPNSSETRWLRGTAGQTTQQIIDAYNVEEGGEPGAVSGTTGPFWEEDTDMAGRSPMHPGAIPASDPAKTLSPEENFGEGAHLQTDQEVAPHIHNLDPKNLQQSPGSGSVDGILFQAPGTGSGNAASPAQVIAATNEYTTVQKAMPVIHPIRGRVSVVRTARVYWRAT